MNRMDEMFARVREEKRAALIPFLTTGDPDVETSVAIIQEAERAGADLIELGVPYSDPLADGPVIQRASLRALAHGMTIWESIAIAKKARERGVQVPFLLFTYYNPVLQAGLDKLLVAMKEAEVDGLLIPDLPYEEDEEVRKQALEMGVNLVPLVAPTSQLRVEKITARASGFIYCVSSLGVTGERASFHHDIDQFLDMVRASTSLPIAVGFGISNREQAAQFASRSDGVIVGSAIIRKVEECLPLLQDPQTRDEGLQAIHAFIADLKQGTLEAAEG